MKKLGFGCMRFPMQGETIDVEEVEKNDRYLYGKRIYLL